MHGLLLQRLLQLALAVLIAACSPLAALDQAPKPPAWSSGCGTDSVGTWADLVVNGSVLRLRWIPPGSFTMGSAAGDSPWRGEDEMQHPVTIESGFWLAESEVTQDLWQEVMGSNPSQFIDPKRPVDSVSWNDAQRFINLLRTRVTGFDVRLPSEAEWEYACRAGTTTPFAIEANAKPAQTINDLGWYRSDADAQTHAVKLKQPNAWGLYDMHGNVQEWCQDVYGHYQSRGTGQSAIGTGERVSRGGSWRQSDWSARSAARRAVPAEQGDNDQGLRLAVTAPAPER